MADREDIKNQNYKVCSYTTDLNSFYDQALYKLAGFVLIVQNRKPQFKYINCMSVRTVWAVIGKSGKVLLDTQSKKIPQNHPKVVTTKLWWTLVTKLNNQEESSGKQKENTTHSFFFIPANCGMKSGNNIIIFYIFT